MVDCLEICRASQAHCHCKICCAFNHIRKTQDEATLWSRIVYHLQGYTQYRAIQLATTKGIVETPFLYNDISVQGYTVPCRSACEKLYTYIPIHSYMLYPYTNILGITVYANTLYRYVQTTHLYSVYPYTHYNAIQRISVYCVSANTRYTPIRRRCVYAYKLILCHDVQGCHRYMAIQKVQTRNQYSVLCLHNRINGATVRRVLQTAGWVQSESGPVSSHTWQCTW